VVKRIVICAAQIPFERGGAELLVESLRDELRRRGHEVEIVRLPFKWYPKEQILKTCLAWRLLDLTESNGQPIDLVIGTKFPSYAVRHPQKVVWLVHQYRQVYDLVGTEYDDLAQDPEAARFRAAIRRIDRQVLGEATKLYTIAGNVSQRLERFNHLISRPLYPPPPLEGRYQCREYGDFVFTVGRLDPLKRIDWLVRAMAMTRSPVRCLIAGDGPKREKLETLAHELGIRKRVRFLGRVSDEELVDLYARCMAVYYAPYDEDYGYVTIEAFKSHKPVLTGDDSGGVLEFVVDEQSGFVMSPDHERQLAKRIDQLYEDREVAQALGETGAVRAESITWDSVVTHLLQNSA
jgi:glycosyltransferase involved in cell wall biosynthesis